MILLQDIFATTKESIGFLLHLYTVRSFTIEQISSHFNISKWVLYKKVKYWEEAKMITLITQKGEKGGKQYKYQITNRLSTYLRNILFFLIEELDLEDVNIKIEKK